MTLSREEVEHIAELAKLTLTEEEIQRYGEQLSDILAFVEQLNEVDTSAIPPTASVLPLNNVLRPDVARTSLSNDEALANGPRTADGQFRVAAVLDESP